MTNDQFETIRGDIAFYAILGFSMVAASAGDTLFAWGWLIFALLLRVLGKVRLRSPSTGNERKGKA